MLLASVGFEKEDQLLNLDEKNILQHIIFCATDGTALVTGK